jgi:hypothetical protein
MSKWISVKDRLPEKYERVVVTDGKQVCLHYKQSGFNMGDFPGDDLFPIGDLEDKNGKWVNCCYIQEGDITHWTELPEAPHE